jgi:hypothetical protein
LRHQASASKASRTELERPRLLAPGPRAAPAELPAKTPATASNKPRRNPAKPPLDAPATPALCLRLLKRTSGGIGRRAGFRFRYRKVWGFKSLLVHSLALWASGALVGTWGDFGSACGGRLRQQVPALRANGLQQPGLCRHSEGLGVIAAPPAASPSSASPSTSAWRLGPVVHSLGLGVTRQCWQPSEHWVSH